MIVTMQPAATLKEISGVIRLLESFGAQPSISRDCGCTLVTAATSKTPIDTQQVRAQSGVRDVHEDVHPFKRVSRDYHPQDSVIDARAARFGGGGFAVIAGPCAVENDEQIHRVAAHVAKHGATGLRGGAFKPRTSPYAFQGMGVPGLKLLRDAARANNLAAVSEVMSIEQVADCVEHLDVLQVGARNMQNFDLLKEVGKTDKPVLLKRGPSSKIEELLLAAEYIVDAGNPRVVLCERGIRTYETATRNTLDIAAVPVVKQLSHLPIIIDPSHAAGKREYVHALTLAALAVGADGVMVEVHPEPAKALSDGRQSLHFDEFEQLMLEVRRYAELRSPVPV
ncbi:MAG: 3-deoxy-7-phosphoheptulonate synthase [Planctomycetes bacterium]|nr:3-deoxy-7-phosphoheptulonate synthase [Planctomycetota bacterium]MCW8136423.1 3-deoxy-7-phosphoheptulonate synthase [Planctomycetota bacterium]